MFNNHDEFITRFLHRLRDDWTYSSPSTETIQEATAVSRDEIGFDRYCAQFTILTDIMDACATESLWGGNPLKHHRVLALAKLEPSQRAMIVVAAAQGLLWMDQCGRWRQHTPKNEIALGVMVAVLIVAGRFRGGYSADQLAALARIGASSQDMDLRFISARGTIAEILALNIRELPRSKETLTPLKQFLDFTARYPANLNRVVKAIDKLTPIMTRKCDA